MTCTILGDSIAVGLYHAAPHCEHHARVGITAAQFHNEYVFEINSDFSVISLGANDARIPEFAELGYLRVIRHRIKSPNVVWLLPICEDQIRAAILTVAEEYGDRVVNLQLYANTLHLPAAGYKKLAGDLKL